MAARLTRAVELVEINAAGEIEITRALVSISYIATSDPIAEHGARMIATSNPENPSPVNLYLRMLEHIGLIEPPGEY